MKKKLFIPLTIIFLLSTAIAQAEELRIFCELKEELNFRSPVQVVYLKVDMKNKTVNGIASTVLGSDIITYETDAESLTLVMPSMYITVVRKGRGDKGADITYIGECHRDKLKIED